MLVPSSSASSPSLAPKFATALFPPSPLASLARLAALGVVLALAACGGAQELGSTGPTSAAPAVTAGGSDTPRATTALTVRASGSVDAGVGGLMEVRFKGEPAGLVEVREAGATDYRFVLDGIASREDIDVVWLNPDSQDAPARQLTVASVQLQTPTARGLPLGAKPAAPLAAGQDKATASGARALSCPGLSTALVVRAAASPAAGIWPLVQVRADGLTVASFSVPSWGMADYRFTLPALAAGSRVDIVFTNDGWQGSDDRNLFVESISLNGQVLLPTSAGVVYDRGAIDGLDVIPGQKMVLWTGALRFPTPAAVAVAADCGGTATPPATPPTATTGCSAGQFCEFAGLNVKFSQGQPLSELPTLPELGVRWVRDSVRASDIEPGAGRFAPFSAEVLQRFSYYRDKGIGLVFVMPLKNDVAYPATTAAPHRPYDPVAYGRRAVEIARMLRAIGVKFVLEVGNEPHNELYAVMGGQWQGRLPSAWVTHYTSMVREAVRQVKAYDASVKLLADDDMWVVHYWFLEAGLPADLDGLAVHPYTPTIPELAAVQYNTSWTAPFQVVDTSNSMVSGIRRLKAQARSKWGREPEIWITEMGWPISGTKSVSEATLASYLPRFFVTTAAAGVKGIQWFSSQDSVDGPMGLTANGGARRLPFQSFKTMTAQLGAYQIDGQILGADTPTSGVQAYAFSGGGDPLLMVWSADGVRRSVALRSGLQAAGASTVLGAVQAVCAASGARGPALPVGPEPIYLKVRGVGKLGAGDLQVSASAAPC